ncbi:hypothetical protein [Nocardia sp. SSK8]|uniref:hypothetical protein n=1 Tax=Nocardia sp. SSK8 TaxID=3120154 RepID=UPI00300A325B
MAPKDPKSDKDDTSMSTVEMFTGVPPGSMGGNQGSSSDMATVNMFTGVSPAPQSAGGSSTPPPAGGLEDVIVMTTSGKPSAGETVELPSGTEWSVGETRSETIEVPGKTPLVVDRGYVPPAADSYAGQFDGARLGSSADVFHDVFKRWPETDADWSTAVFLNPNSYTEKYGGVGPSIQAVMINPVPGKGVVRATHFIEQFDVYNPWPGRLSWEDFAGGDFSFPEDRGDNRTADPNFDPESGKISVIIDYENGIVVMRQNPSVAVRGGDVEVATPQATIWQSPDGEIRMKYSGRDGFLPSMGEKTGTVNGDIVVTPGENGVELSGVRTDYPSFEAYHDTPGSPVETALIDPAASGAKHGPMVNLWFQHELPGGEAALDRYRQIIVSPWGGPAILADVPGGVKLGPVDDIPRVPRANGGFVSGPGGSTEDLIAAWLSDGEYVVNAKAARQFGGILEAINSGDFSALLRTFAPQTDGGGLPELPSIDTDALLSGGAEAGLSGGLSGALSGLENGGLIGGLTGGIQGAASAAGSQIGSSIGAAIGTAVGGPVGSAIGGALGSVAGSEVLGTAAEFITKPIEYAAETAKEVIGTGFGLVDLAEGPGAHTARGDIYNFNGMDPKSAAVAVERVRRRRVLAQQRGGGLGR